MERSTEQLVDELLVMRCQDGDAAAMDALVGRWHERLLRHACRLTGSLEAAREAVQDAWLGIVRGLRRLDDAGDVRAAMAGLSDAQRIALTLHYLDGLSVAEIAEVQDVPIGTVKSRLHHGRAELKRRLKQDD